MGIPNTQKKQRTFHHNLVCHFSPVMFTQLSQGELSSMLVVTVENGLRICEQLFLMLRGNEYLQAFLHVVQKLLQYMSDEAIVKLGVLPMFTSFKK